MNICHRSSWLIDYLVLMSSKRESVWLERATLDAVKSEAWSLMSSTILCKGLRHELCICKKNGKMHLTSQHCSCIYSSSKDILDLPYKIIMKWEYFGFFWNTLQYFGFVILLNTYYIWSYTDIRKANPKYFFTQCIPWVGFGKVGFRIPWLYHHCSSVPLTYC